MALEGPAEVAGGLVAQQLLGGGDEIFAAGDSPNAFYGHRVWSRLWTAARPLRARSSQLEFGGRHRIARRTHLRASEHVGM
jgi:hypothetical protein